MSQQIIDQLNKLLTPAAKVVWEAAVRQQYVIAFQQVAFGLLLTIFAIGCWRVRKKIPSDDFDRAVMSGALVVVSCAMVCVALALLSDAVGHIINPYAGAINWLLHGQG